MNTVEVTMQINRLTLDEIWDILTDIEKYPQRVKYVKKVKIRGELKEGTCWEDTTAILWIPQKMTHTITSFKKNKEYSFSVPLYFGGIMTQTYQISTGQQKATLIKGTISYDCKNKFANRLTKIILNPKLKDMLESTFKSFDGNIL